MYEEMESVDQSLFLAFVPKGWLSIYIYAATGECFGIFWTRIPSLMRNIEGAKEKCRLRVHFSPTKETDSQNEQQ